MFISTELFEVQRACECKSKQTEYFLFKKDLAVPEYIIQYEYLYKHHADDAFEKELVNIETNGSKLSSLSSPLSKNEETIEANVSNEVVSRAIRMQIPASIESEDPLDINNLVELNLHNIGLTSIDIQPICDLKQLRKLILSFNKIKSLKEINSLVILLNFNIR